MSTMTKSTLGVALALALAACSSPTVRMSAEPPSDIDRTKGRPVSASACGFQLLQLVPVGTNGRQQDAYDALKTQAGSDYIGDVVMTEEWYYGVIGSVYCTKLDAKAYPKRAS
jgi:hypothetical protein